MNDDTVEYELYRDGRRSAAHVVRILKRGRTEVVGVVRRFGPDLGITTPEGEALALARNEGAAPGEWVVARIQEYPSEENAGVVVVDQRLGKSLQPKHDNQLAIARFGLSESFPPEVVNDAKEGRAIAEQALKHLGSRVDHRQKLFVTIDGEDAKDFDDAVLVEKSEHGGFILYVAIADVSSFVREGRPLDREARRRGTSVYFPGFVIPMLPEILSNELCSLRPREEKLALT